MLSESGIDLDFDNSDNFDIFEEVENDHQQQGYEIKAKSLTRSR